MASQPAEDGHSRGTMYEYDALPNGMSIRMLTLLPGHLNDPLKGELEFVDIEDSGLYEPLSYVWGDDTRTHKIFLHDAELGLTTSLYHALRRLRQPDQSRRVWADQICIDQSNLDERSQQVQFMNSIYWNASHVLVWLGQDEQNVAEEAFALVRKLADTFADEEEHAKFRLTHTDRLAEQSSESWTPLKHITDLPWFRRAWIVQEIGTKAPATMLWGDVQIDWQLLHGVSEQLTEYHHLRAYFEVKTAEIKYVFQRFIEPERTNRHANRFSFIYELHRARHLKVTDPRDRVFAMLGHYSIREGHDTELQKLKADYKKTLEQVYTDVAIRALSGEYEALITLGAIQHMSLPSTKDFSKQAAILNEHKMPSWAPDWQIYQSHILSEPTSPHRACGSTKPKLSINSSSLILSIYGVRLDSVAASSEGLAPKEFHIDGKQRVLAIDRLWREICGMKAFDLTDKYVNGESSFFAYTQTLSSGCIAVAWQEGVPYYEVPKEKWLQHGAAYVAKAMEQSQTQTAVCPEIHELAKEGNPSKWSRAANGASSNRKFTRTEKGYYVLGPKVMEKGDIVCVLFGGKMPFCLRPWGDKYLLVGECYVHGFMNGEVDGMLESDEVFHVV